MVRHIPGGVAIAFVALVVVACGQPSAEMLAAEQLIEEQLADDLELVLDATCEEPSPPTEIRCVAEDSDGAQVIVVGTIGADELSMRTLNVVTGDRIEDVVASFAVATADLALPMGSLDCGQRSIVVDLDNTFPCQFVASSEHAAAVVVTVDGLDGPEPAFTFDVSMGAEIAAEGIIERSILPDLGFDGPIAACADADAEGEPFSCGVLLDDGRLLEFVAFDEDGEVMVAAANVLRPTELAKLDSAFADTVGAVGIVVDGARLDCGADAVILDTTSSFKCAYAAPGQVPIEVTVTVSALGTADEAFGFEFAEVAP